MNLFRPRKLEREVLPVKEVPRVKKLPRVEKTSQPRVRDIILIA